MAAQRAGFDACRVTMTKPDGNEYSTVVWVDHAAKPRVEQVACEALAAVEIFLGARGGEALLALLAESVLGRKECSDDDIVARVDELKETGYV